MSSDERWLEEMRDDVGPGGDQRRKRGPLSVGQCKLDPSLRCKLDPSLKEPCFQKLNLLVLNIAFKLSLTFSILHPYISEEWKWKISEGNRRAKQNVPPHSW